MSDFPEQFDELGMRINVDPEPTPEEMVAILEVVRRILADDEPRPAGGENESRWALAARREGLRPPHWPPQSRMWEARLK